MKIYTRTGDDGTTSLFGGKRVSKSHLRLHAYGTTDELNSFIGLLSDQPEMHHERDFLRLIQNKLFSIGSMLATDDPALSAKLPQLQPSDVEALEQQMDTMDTLLPPLRNFILPGGHPAVSLAHICRTICRRAERYTTELLVEGADIQPIINQYLNRLSDYFFVLARFVARRTGVEEVPWKPE